MTVDADALLAGPRGRRLLLEYALADAERADTAAAREAIAAVFWAALPFESSSTTVLLRPGGDPEAPETPRASPAEAAAALDSLTLGSPTHAALRDALARSVDAARYWQPPDGRDVLGATDDVRQALRRVAALVAGSPAAAWWGSGVAGDDQWEVPWEGAGLLADPEGALREWREQTHADETRADAERPRDPRANWSGQWWSIPPWSLVRTTRSLDHDGPAGLWFVEDSHGGDEAVATPVDAFPARIVEIDGPEDWALLCRRHPLDVTASRRHDWFRVTGRDGRWVIPDWAAVAAQADAVHLTVSGYLSAATRLIEVDGDHASVLAGWNPDETYWFRGAAERPVAAQRWRRRDDLWHRVRE